MTEQQGRLFPRNGAVYDTLHSERLVSLPKQAQLLDIDREYAESDSRTTLHPHALIRVMYLIVYIRAHWYTNKLYPISVVGVINLETYCLREKRRRA